MVLKSQAQSQRRLLAGGATLTVFGIAMSTGELASLAGVLTLGGLSTIIVGLHRFGRTGPDQPATHEFRGKRSKTRPKRSRKTRTASNAP